MSARTDTSSTPRYTGAVRAPRDSSESVRFGEFLRNAREGRGLSIQQISYETKIPGRHLESLEHGHLLEVPGGAYRRGEIIAYANAVGLDRTLALAQLERALQSFEAQEPAARQARFPYPRVGHRSLLFAGLVGAAIVGAMLWRLPAVHDDSATAPGEGSEGQAADVGAAKAPPAPAAPTTLQRRTAASQGSASGSSAAIEPLPAENGEAAASTGGELVIASEPPGARVTVDGIGWGTTPLTIRNLPAGFKQIRVTKDGYSAEVRVVRLAAERATVSIPLRRTR
jgi:cytoskeletal protein RodZ